MTDEQVKKMAIYASSLSKGDFYDPSMRLYDRSNENLVELFRIYDVSDQDILTVLASSDQLFSCYSMNPRSVDTFDKVYITMYYYYLRKWIIKYQKHTYPSHLFFYDHDMELYQLICDINPDDIQENEARIFWKTYLEYNDYHTSNYLFNIALADQPRPFNIHSDFFNKIFDKPLNFTCFDLFMPMELNKKYDVVILSNMLEYAQNIEQLKCARDNIETFLRDDGIVICTYKIAKHTSPKHLRELQTMTSGNLCVMDAYHEYYEPLFGKKMDLAYSYQLKKR